MSDKKILVKLKYKNQNKLEENIILYNDLRLKKYFLEMINCSGKNSMKKQSYESIKDAFNDLIKIVIEKNKKPFEKYLLNSDLETYKFHINNLYKYLK